MIALPVLLIAILKPLPFPESIRQANADLSASTSADDQKPILATLLEFEPWRGDLWERIGRESLDEGDTTAAIQAFEQGETLGELSIDGKIAQADALILSGDVEAAKLKLRAITISQAALFDFLQIIALQRKIGDVYGAEATLLIAHHAYPENAEINIQLGVLLTATQPESAVQFLSAVDKLEGNDLLLKNALITTIANTSDLTAAEKYQVIGQVLSNFGEWDVAAQAFQSALANDPASALAWIYLAEAQQQIGQNGFEAVEKALELDADNEIVNGLAGLYYRRQGKYELSLLYLEKAARINPATNVWITEQSRAYEEMGDLGNAYDLLISVVEMSPGDTAALKNLAIFCFTNNYEAETTGLDAARKALSYEPSSPVLLDLLGTGLMMAGDYDSAERFFLQADTIDPHQSAILIHLGQLKILQGAYDQARVYLQQAADYSTTNRLRDLALQLLNETTGK